MGGTAAILMTEKHFDGGREITCQHLYELEPGFKLRASDTNVTVSKPF